MNNLIKVSRLPILLIALTVCMLFSSCRKCNEDCASFENFKLCDAPPAKDACDQNMNVFEPEAEYVTVNIDILKGESEDDLTIVFFQKVNDTWAEIYTETSALKDISDDLDGDEKRITAFIGVSRQDGSAWPLGEYKVEIELTQEVIPLNQTQNFTVE